MVLLFLRLMCCLRLRFLRRIALLGLANRVLDRYLLLLRLLIIVVLSLRRFLPAVLQATIKQIFGYLVFSA